MLVTPDGSSLIGAGLDHWYESEISDGRVIDPAEFRFAEWRLERELGVDWFGLPPDYRARRADTWSSTQQINAGLTVPFLRFPQWHVCPSARCGYLQQWPLAMKDRPACPRCARSAARRSQLPTMVQVRFIALCDAGHIQDFPWRNWVHAEFLPTCQRDLRLTSGARASLAGIRIQCECGAQRSLERITQAEPPPADSSYLSSKLCKNHEYRCSGARPWLADETGSGCGRALRGSLRGATNVYYALVRSSIFLPLGNSRAPTELVDFLQTPGPAELLKLYGVRGEDVLPQTLRLHYGAVLNEFSDEQIIAAVSIVLKETNAPAAPAASRFDDPETAFRRAEVAALRRETREEGLNTRLVPSANYSADLAGFLEAVTLCEKLTETRVLTGFARVYPDNSQTLEERFQYLWRDTPPKGKRWLPGYLVHGEGIYLELSEARIRAWEQTPAVQTRLKILSVNFETVQRRRRTYQRSISPRLIALHTLAHLLMNQFTFECGYSTASLRERLYISHDPEAPMAGILIYTAAGDSEGTMGGLVRMGKPGNLEPIVRKAVAAATWCSADPICMELGAKGQGPDSCNLAACHNCALVPETSCEEFNRLLDRALLVGTLDREETGLLSALRAK